MSSAYVEIPLTRGYVALVDVDDYEHVRAMGSWYTWVRTGVRACYAARAVPRSGGGQTTLYLHTFLTGWQRVDHKNGDGLDNRRSNLRSATQTQNRANARARGGASQFKGVWRERPSGRWAARIGINGTRRYLGSFDTDEAAARAYDTAALVLFGEFARLNFPPGGAQ